MSFSPQALERLQELGDGLTAGNQFIRLTDSHSITKLDDDGFVCSLDRHEGTVPTAGEWREEYHRLRGNQGWVKERSEEIARHVNGGWQGYGTGDVSPWISATTSLEWAAWEICRRLVVLRWASVVMSIIESSDHYHSSFRGSRLVRVDNWAVVQILEQDGTEYCQQAANFARASSEVLFFKRVFAKAVVDTYEWTKEVFTFRVDCSVYEP